MYQPWLSDPKWFLKDRDLVRYEDQKYQRPSLPFDSKSGLHTLLGPRRVGKTTQFKLWIREVLQKFPPEKIFYLDAERFESWKELLPILEQVREGILFLDEVTAVDQWSRAIKIMVDEGRWDLLCVWITGSNAFDISHLGERLPGRRGRGLQVRDCELLPLSFREFYPVVSSRKNLTIRQGFELFCQWGGYPMAVSECLTREEPSYDLLQEFLDVALGATSKKHRSPRLTAALAERLWMSLGSRVSYNALAKHVDAVSHPIIRQYIEILEGCYAIIPVERLNSKTKTGILRKEKKIYFWDPLIMAALVSWAEKGSVDPQWIKRNWDITTRQGGWIENMVASELKKRKLDIFYDEQFGGEIDFVFKSPTTETWSAIEIKRSAPSRTELKPLQAYPHAEAWVFEATLSNGPGCYSLAERLLEFLP